MVKSAAQIPSLKSQLLNIALFRFADTTDFLQSGFNSGNFTYQSTAVTNDVTYDDSGQVTYPGFLGTAGTPTAFVGTAQGLNIPIVTQSTSALPANLTAPPTGLGFSSSNSGGSLRPGTVNIGIAPVDASSRIGPVTWIQVNYPANGSTSGSVTLTWTPPAQSQVYYYIFKQAADGNFYYTNFGGNGTTSYTDTTSAFGNVSNQGTPAQNTNATIDPVTNLAVAYNTTGGGWSSPTYTFRLGAYNAIGDTLAGTAVDVPFASPVNSVTMTSVTATPTTGTGTLAAGTYYYRVAPFGPATTQLGYEGIAGTEVSATLSATGNINLTWPTVANASGFVIYRGTSAGTETYLTSFGGGGITSYNDSGSLTPAVKYPPQTTNGAGFIATGSITLNWTTLANAGGYYLYTARGANTLGNAVFNSYFAIAAGTTTFVYTGQAATGTRYTPTFNFAAVNAAGSNITTVGRYMTPGNSSVNVIKFGFTVALVSGKTYRWIVYNQSYGQPVNSTFVASSSAVQYYEYSVPFQTGTPGVPYFFALSGTDATSYISWQPTNKPSTNDYVPNTLLTFDGGTVVSANNTTTFTGAAIAYGSNVSNSQQAQYVKDDTLAGVPFRLTWRASYTAASQISARGTFVGNSANDVQQPLRLVTTNQTYSTPIKSIVPTWSTATPTNSYLQAQAFLNSRNIVEVSTDAGATWTVVALNARYQFPTAVTQIMFRVTVPARVAMVNVVRGVTSPFTANTPTNGYGPTNGSPYGNYQMIADTGQALYDYSAYSTNTQNGFFYADGFYAPGFNPNDRTYEIMGLQGYGHDVDAQVWCLPQGRTGGIGVNSDSNASGTQSAQGGFWFGIDNSNAYITKIQSVGTNTTIATFSGGVTAGQYNLLRLIVNGSHLLGFLNNRLVFDITDTSYTAANYNVVGLRGSGGILNGFQVANITAGQTNTNPWEFEFLSAYLEN